jgi:hypothetical protein
MMKPIQMLGVVDFAVGVVLSKTSVAVMQPGNHSLDNVPPNTTN